MFNQVCCYYPCVIISVTKIWESYQTHKKIKFLSQKSLFVGYLDIIDTKSQQQTVIKSVIKMNL